MEDLVFRMLEQNRQKVSDTKSISINFVEPYAIAEMVKILNKLSDGNCDFLEKFKTICRKL